MTDRRTATRAERKRLVHPDVLRQQRRDAVDRRRRFHAHIAHHEGGDLAGRRQVARHVGGGDRQHAGNVVEPVAGVVGGKQRTCIDVQPQQVADGVGVMRLVHATDRARPYLRRAFINGVNRALDPRHNRGPGGSIRLWHTAGRHGHCAEPPPNLFPRLRAGGDVVDIQPLEHEATGPGLGIVTRDAVRREKRASIFFGSARPRRRCRTHHADDRDRQETQLHELLLLPRLMSTDSQAVPNEISTRKNTSPRQSVNTPTSPSRPRPPSRPGS